MISIANFTVSSSPVVLTQATPNSPLAVAPTPVSIPASQSPSGSIATRAHGPHRSGADEGDDPSSAAPLLLAPAHQIGPQGTPLGFDVMVADGPSLLSASGLPAGAAFDGTTGTFSWTPSAGDIGAHQIVLSAATSVGATATQIIEVGVVTGSAATAPEILTVGDARQAFAVHTGTFALAAAPTAVYDGYLAKGGEVLSLLVTGIDCGQDLTTRNYQVKLGAVYTLVRSAQALAGDVCQIGVEVPNGLSGSVARVSLEVASQNGGVVSSNTAIIGVAN